MSNDIDSISSGNLAKISESTGSRRVDAERSEQAPQQRVDAPAGDTVALTDSARIVERAASKLADAPSINPALVDSVREQIDNGSYQIDDQAVADKILRSDQERG